MAEKNLSSRIINKHDIEANWTKATNFIPKQGEIIVYDIDENYTYERFKIGDGITLVSNLPFIKTGLEVSDTEEELEEGVYLTNADLLGGIAANNYALKANVVTSVNGQTGDVVVTEGGGSIDTSNFYSTSNPPPYPVTSVNGSTGSVQITAASLGALTSAPVTSVGGKTGAVTLSAGTGISVSGTTISNSGVTSVNGHTGEITIPAIKYVDLTFTFSGESLCQYATAPSDLTSSGQIINVISHTDSVIITAAEISGGKILIYGRDPSKISTDEWSGSYIDFKTGSFSARVFYF